jgi:hypothetical protein
MQNFFLMNKHKSNQTWTGLRLWNRNLSNQARHCQQ